ncbi:uncharacterized protein BJ212DRAFT_1299870 [Suillus subaureus]|uniref:Uncharacterized protein n=1 Tax=Suillus subaureus TaxID=48587 RepID=A0A9P7EAM7_9AGAM|nr:uncharacterized protein BJ212DRAFT_1299870 [Suillus subaureus]KAG1816020.1 hypothetical protein BJ212DRAFT_1299870 [Suillus subaureus]
MGSAKNKKKPGPKPKPKPISKPGSKKTSATSPLNIDSLPEDVLTATQGLLGLSNGLKETQEYHNSEQPDPSNMLLNDDEFLVTTKDDAAENGDRVTLDPEAMSNSTESSDEEDEEDEDSAFDLEFMVPINGATDSATYSSNITWTNFHYQKELPRVLQTPVHLARLFVAAQKELRKNKVKKKGGRKDGQKRAKSKKDDSDSKQAGDSDETDIVLKKKTAPQYIIELQAEHACGNHSGEYCVILPNRSHHHLTNKDLSLWSLLLTEGVHTSLKDPPSELKIEDVVRPLRIHKQSQSQPEMSSHPFPYYYPYPPPPPPGYGALHYHHYSPQTPTP